MKRVVLGIFLQITGLYFLLQKDVLKGIVIFYVLISTITLFFLVYIKNRGTVKNYEVNKRILESIIQINDCILKVENKEQLYQLVLQKAVEIIPDAQMGSILILKENNILEFAGTVGFSFDKVTDIKIKLEDTFLYRKSNGNIQKPCIIDDVKLFNEDVIVKDLKEKIQDTDFFITQSTISAPIIINGVLYGMINVDNPKKGAFTEKDLLLMEYFASQIGTIIQRHQLLERMKYLSNYDSLTNIYNRSYFEQKLSEAYSVVERENENFTLVLFDLNDLKIINDNYGHDMGDKLIVTFASAIKNIIDDQTIFARYGGDEFIALFVNKDRWEVNKIIKEIEEVLSLIKLDYLNEKIPLSFSYGISTYPNDSKDIKRLITIADTRMYKDKGKKKSKG
ncbi:diguanylate cyclase (GGDEF) domain-containing protein [Anaerobranca californiensis DSM 14826]|uniref:Diguanylate cyclase (GGDEF) domain-containing protein n=1 Tax=Anaerobranca californiensis DSM 14826 TaxID=1120989 RepID=A0A1M6LMD2_9FIRM|nr:sensor domain-containing diguanylate cyclase [Anaerobranca californiensis]SHJ72401.1 diguanylate cyclase (GGDEF) domain-containing protein [Anaerobranca californiensis DSM 14826]